MLHYLVQVTIAWALFALLYGALLRKETFFALNRAFLLGTAALGLCLPFLPALFETQGATLPTAALLPEITIGLRAAETSVLTPLETIMPWIWGVYILGLALAMARTLWGVFNILRLVAQGERQVLSDGCVLVRSASVALPVSFFHWILTPADFETEAGNHEMQAMLAHERAHAHKRHSVDVMLMEFLCVLCWFHPLAHWYRKALRTVHEYQADAEAVQKADRKEYGLLLLRQAQSGKQVALVHHFFQSPLKQRLMMLTQGHSPLVRRWKYALAAPVLMFLFVAAQSNALPATQEAAADTATLDQAPAFPGGQEALMQYLAKQIKYPESAKRDQVSGMSVVQFVVEKDGTLSGFTALKKIRQDLDDEAIRVLKAMPNWSPGIKDGQAVRAQMMLPIRFRLD
jgi:TonB family protein